MTLVYNIEQINNIRDNGFIFELSDDSLDVINQISEIVGASSYVKTPIFPKRKNNKIVKHVIDPNFKSTVMVFNEEEEFRKVRSHLNKLTEKTLDVIFVEIEEIIKKIIESDNSEKLNEIANFIFETASNNKCYSSVYATAYLKLINNYPIFKSILDNHLDNHIDLFKKVETVDPSENYELFCNLNRINDERRATSLFISNLFNKDIVDTPVILNIILILKNNSEDLINIENQSPRVAEINENIIIIIQNSFDKLLKCDKWDEINEFVKIMCKRKSKEFKSLPSKSIFKFMDINDRIKDLDK